MCQWIYLYTYSIIVLSIKEGGKKVTTIEVARLIEWLKSKGMTEKEVYECINFIATGKK